MLHETRVSVGEVWVLRCVGHELLCLLLGIDDDGIDFFDIEGDRRFHWHGNPTYGVNVGEWRRWGHGP